MNISMSIPVILSGTRGETIRIIAVPNEKLNIGTLITDDYADIYGLMDVSIRYRYVRKPKEQP